MREVLATASGTLFESTPFILAATLLQRIARGSVSWLVPLLGCGCAGGPAARSIPATVALWLAFGPWIALGRWTAAMLVGALVARGRHCDAAEPLAALEALVPYALLAGLAAHGLALAGGHLPAGPAAPIAGAVVAFALAPCGLGVAGIAGALRSAAPACALGFLAVAGIADVRAFARSHAHGGGSDGGAYALLAIACGVAAMRGGATLVHPRFALALAFCACACVAAAWANRTACVPRRWLAPATMCAALVIGAPAPSYRATATTLADAFAGEPLEFTGTVARDRSGSALVRFAITCCRADAAPVVVRLDRDPGAPTGTWLRAAGTLVDRRGDLRLRATVTTIAPPSDPFVYR